jgi:hypothetical protein
MNQENETPVEIETTEIVALDLTFKPEIFDPNKEQLHAIAAEVAKIEANPELMTKEDLELINTTKNKLVKARTRIQKIGKAQREPATAYAKEVKAYEDSLLAILAPQEARMKDLESAAKTHAMNEERMKTLPEYIEKLLSIDDGIHAETSFLLSLDPNQRDQYYNERLAAKNEADRAALAAEREAAEAKRQEEEAAANAKIEADRKALITARREIMLQIGFKPFDSGLALETIDGIISFPDFGIHDMSEAQFATESSKWHSLAEAKKAADLAATEARAKEQAEKEAAQRAADEEAKRQAEAKAAQEEAARVAEQAAKEEAARRSSEAYQKWLSDSSYNEQTDIIQENAGVYTLYRKVSSYQPEAFGFEPKV